MATAAQIEANRRNAQRSTWPKTQRGKIRARRNAVTHGMTARIIMPVLPQEDPKELEDKTQQAITAIKPRDLLELDLVCRAVRLSGELDRAERVATAHLAHRVRMAARSGPETVSACELKKVHELGSKLFYKAGIGPGYSSATADDYPAVIVRRLEESAEGCRWLLARWAELLNVIDCKAAWGDPEIIRFVGLMGKRGIEAHFDPELNSLFHAFDALGNRIGHKFWNHRRDGLPLGYIGGFQFVSYREIAPPPSDETAALSLIRSVIERHVGRLEELLAEHEEIEAEEAAERYDRAALDCSPAFERHRRYQSARHRELMRTLETLRKMRKEEFGTGNGEGKPGTVASGQWSVASESGENGERQVAPGGCGEGKPETVVSGQWSVASESGESGEPTQEECRAPRNAQNEANPESTQSSLSLVVESSVPEPERRKRSQLEGDDAPRSTLHASSPQWPVSLKRVASGDWRRVAAGKANPKQWSVASGQWPVNLERVASRREGSARHRKMCKTKPIRNQRKVHCRLKLNHPCPSLRVENEAKLVEITLHAPGSTHGRLPSAGKNGAIEANRGASRKLFRTWTQDDRPANRRTKQTLSLWGRQPGNRDEQADKKPGLIARQFAHFGPGIAITSSRRTSCVEPRQSIRGSPKPWKIRTRSEWISVSSPTGWSVKRAPSA